GLDERTHVVERNALPVGAAVAFLPLLAFRAWLSPLPWVAFDSLPRLAWIALITFIAFLPLLRSQRLELYNPRLEPRYVLCTAPLTGCYGLTNDLPRSLCQ